MASKLESRGVDMIFFCCLPNKKINVYEARGFGRVSGFIEILYHVGRTDLRFQYVVLKARFIRRDLYTDNTEYTYS